MSGYPSYDYPEDDNEKLELLFKFLFKFKSWQFLEELLMSLDWKLDYIQKIHVKQLLIKSGDVLVIPGEDTARQFKIKDEVILGISKYGSYKKYRISKMDKRELKHFILEYLMKEKEKWFSKIQLEGATEIEGNKLDSLVFDMKDNDATVDINDETTMEGFDYIIRINPKGKGYFLDKEYLKEEKPLVLPLKLNQQFINKNYGIANQDSDFSESEESQSVTTTPKINESKAIKIPWYKSTLFKYVIYPLLVIVITWLIISLIKGKLQLPT